MSDMCCNRGMERRKKKTHDFSVTALRAVQEAMGQIEQPRPKPSKTFDAVALDRLGGLKGGKVRAERLSPERRTEIAKKAALARWETSNRV